MSRTVALARSSCLALMFAAIGIVPPSAAIADQAGVDSAREAMMAGSYRRAAELLAGEAARAAGDAEQGPHLRYLHARALQLAGDCRGAIRSFDRLEAEFPDSPWIRKARFGRADCQLALGDADGAADAYRAGTESLLAVERRDELVGVLLRYAHAALEPDDERVPPDVQTAHALFSTGLALEPSSALRHEADHALARCEIAMGAHAAAADRLARRLDDPDDPLAIEDRFQLGRALAIHQPAEAVRQFHLLASTHPEHARAAEALWEAALLQAPDDQQAPLDAGGAVADLRALVDGYPDFEHAAEAHLRIASVLRWTGRLEPAAEAFADYADDPRRAAEPERADALLALAALYEQLGRREDARAVTLRYSTEHPTHREWSRVQRSLAGEDDRRGRELLAAGDVDGALAALQRHADAHPADDAETRYLIGLAHLREGRDDQAAAAFEIAASKHPTHWAGVRARWALGRIAIDGGGDPEQAREQFEACVDHGDTDGGACWRALADLGTEGLALHVDGVLDDPRAAEVWLSARNLEAVELTLHRVDPELVLRKEGTLDGIGALDVELIAPDERWQVPLEGATDGRSWSGPVDLPTHRPGVYMVGATGTSQYARLPVVVSTIAVAAHRHGDDLLVWVQDRRTGAAVRGARVLVSDGTRVVLEGTTGPDGVYLHSPPPGDEVATPDRAVVLALSGRSMATTELWGSRSGRPEELPVVSYVHTDRPAYRPGDTVGYRAVLHRLADRRHEGMGGETVRIRLRSPEGWELARQRGTLDRFGSVHGTFALPAERGLGAYRVTVSTVGERDEEVEVGAATLQVTDAPPSRRQLQIEFDRGVYVLGDEVTATLRATTYTGEPLVGLRIPFAWGHDDEQQLSAPTDERGEVRIHATTLQRGGLRAVSLRAGLPGESIRVDRSAPVRAAEFDLALDVPRRTLRSGEALPLRLTATGVDGERQDVAVEVALYHTPAAASAVAVADNPLAVPLWLEERERAMLRPAAPVAEPTRTLSLRSGAGGDETTVTLSAPGHYRIVAVARDARGRAVREDVSVEVIGDEGPRDGLALLAPRTRLSAGEPLRLHVAGADAGAALVLIEADGIATARPVRLGGADDELAIPLDPSLAPRARVTVLALRGDQVRRGSLDLTIDAALDVAIALDNAVFRPGDTVEATVRIADEAGRPVDAQVAVAVVASSLLAQYPETRRAAEGVFLAPDHTVAGTTAAPADHRATGHGQTIDADVLAELERLARERDPREAEAIRPEDIDLLAEADETWWLDGDQQGFGGLGTRGHGSGGGGSGYGAGALGSVGGRAVVLGAEGQGQISAFRAESALWIADLTTGADGETRFALEVPAHAAAWRVIAVAFDTGRRSGEATEEFVASAPRAVAVLPPRFVRPGDAPAVVADVLTDADGMHELRPAGGGGEATARPLALTAGRPERWVLAGGPVEVGDAVRGVGGVRQVPFSLALRRGDQTLASDTLGSRLATADSTLERRLAGRADQPIELTLTPPEGAVGTVDVRLDLTTADLPGALALALADPSLCADAPTTHAAVAFAATALLDTPAGSARARRLSREAEDLLRGIARRHLTAMIAPDPSTRQRWDTPLYGHDGTATALGYVALVRGMRLDLLPGGARAEARRRADAARGRLLDRLQNEVDLPDRDTALVLYALGEEPGDDLRWSPVLTRLLRTADDPVARGRLAAAAVRLGMAHDAAELTPVLTDDLARALAGGRADALAPVAEGLAALAPATAALDAAAVELETRLAAPWLPPEQLAARAGALAALQGSGSARPVAADWRTPDGRAGAADLTRGPTRIELSFDAEEGGVRIALEPQGRGGLRYRATLTAAAGPDAAPPDDPRLELTRWLRRPDLRYHGRPLPQGHSALAGAAETWFDELSSLPVGRESQVITEVCWAPDQRREPRGTLWVLEDPLPGGVAVVDGSFDAAALHAEVRDDHVLAYLDASQPCARVRYRVEGVTPGRYGMPAPRLRRLDDGAVIELGEAAVVLVTEQPAGDMSSPQKMAGVELPAGEFRVTPDELYELGRRLARDERWDDAAMVLTRLLELGSLQTDRARNVGADLLRATVEIGDPAGTLRAFELLKERDPGYAIPFDQIAAVARAYEEAGEPRRAIRVYRTTLGARFTTEAQLGRTLEQEGLVMPSLRYVHDLTLAYPDLAPVASSLFHLPQIWADRAAVADTDPGMRARGLDRDTLLATSADWMLEFLARHPDSPLAEEAGFHLAGTYLELERHDRAARVTGAFARRFDDGAYLDSFLFMQALAERSRGNGPGARRLLTRVADESFTPRGGGAPGTSPLRPEAIYSMAQIHDADGRLALALDRYREVAGRFRDAAEAVAQIERVVLTADEVTALSTRDQPRLPLTSRHAGTADLLLYRVDLMRLYLREKDLSRITDIRLAGIEPIHQRKLALGDGYREQDLALPLPIRHPGAYLAVVKADDAELSAMVLFSDLALEVQEDRGAGRVRITVTDPGGRPVEDAHVKVIGSASGALVAGDTDLRGVFAADGVHGVPTVIVRHGEHYAFHRGAAAAPPPPPLPATSSPAIEVDVMEQLRALGYTQRSRNRAAFDEAYYESAVTGVSADQLQFD